MQWYKRWETIRARFIDLPPADRPAWWQRWNALGVTAWDHHETGGLYHPQGTLFDLACHHDVTHLPVLLAQPVDPEQQRDRQERIDRACYEAWHRGDGVVFDLLAPHVQPWAAWQQRLFNGPHQGMTKPGPVFWLDDHGQPRPHDPMLTQESVVLLLLSLSNPDTQAWSLWNARYAHRPDSQAALERLWMDRCGRVSEAACLMVNDPCWAEWAVGTTTSPDRFSQAQGTPLIEGMVARIALAALPQNHGGRSSAPAPQAWFDQQLRKLTALIDTWGLPCASAWSEPMPAGMGRTLPLTEALPLWQQMGHSSLSQMVTLLEARWLTQTLNDTCPVDDETARIARSRARL